MVDPSNKAPVEIGLVAMADTSVSVLYCLHEVFGSVGSAWEELTGQEIPVRLMRPHIVAAKASTFRNSSGMPIAADAAFEDSAVYDVVIATDLAGEGMFSPAGRWPEAAAWLRGQYDRGATICSVCTGTLLLAEAGLLDGHEATTHWGIREVLEHTYPRIKLRPERILSPTGPDSRIITSGGASAWADLALYLITCFSGREEAVRMAKVFLFGDHADGQLPFAGMTKPARHEDATIAECQTWLADHYSLANAVARMDEHSGLPTRTLKRRFRAATGYAPIEYVQTLRVEEAKQLLETTSMPTDSVAANVGYEDPASFRRVFKRLTGITPARYRRRFHGIGTLAA